MAKKAKVFVNPAFTIGEISPRLYSAFLEPIEDMVNGCMYNPKHPEADEQGFRKDWIEGICTAGVPAVRLPGGNFVSGWEWKDSIGPKEKRKTHLDIAWRQYITNAVGHDEYLQWAEKAKVEPMYTVNLGTGRLSDAIELVEYTNFPGKTYWSERRKENGHTAPYGVKVWYLGNEMDGPWQVGSWEKDPKGYGALVNEVSKALKGVDNSIKTAVCVSCSPNELHYPAWDLEVLKQCYDAVDYISMHHYQNAEIGNYAQFMAAARYYEDYIRTEIGLCDYVQELFRSPKTMMLSLDEYGVMSCKAGRLRYGRDTHYDSGDYYTKFNHFGYVYHDPDSPENMEQGEQGDTMLSALGQASVILEMLHHADRVKIGCMTNGLRVASACNHDHVWRSVAYYPYADMINYGQGISLQVAIECEEYDLQDYALDNNHQYHEQNGVKYIDAAAAFQKEKGVLAVFVINRDWEDTASFTLDVSGLEGYRFVSHSELFSEDPETQNTYEHPDCVLPQKNDKTTADSMKVTAELQKLSWNVFLFEKET